MPETPHNDLIGIYLAQRPLLVRLFTRRAGDAALAEDVVQDLYLRLQALEPGYRVDNPQAFLFRSANNIYLNRLRALTSERGRDRAWHDVNHASLTGPADGDPVDDGPSAEDKVAARQQLVLLVESLKTLPDRTQDIFRLHKMEGLSQQEVATRLSVSLSSVEKHLSAALRHLMAHLRRASGEDGG